MFNQTAAFPIIPAGPKSGNLPWLSTQSITELNKFTHSPTMMQIREGRARSWNFSTQLVVHLLNQVTYVEDFSVAADSLSVFAKKENVTDVSEISANSHDTLQQIRQELDFPAQIG